MEATAKVKKIEISRAGIIVGPQAFIDGEPTNEPVVAGGGLIVRVFFNHPKLSEVSVEVPFAEIEEPLEVICSKAIEVFKAEIEGDF